MASSPVLRGNLLRYLLIPLIALSMFSAVATYQIARRYANVAFDRALLDSVETIEEQIRITQGKASLDLPSVAWDILGYDSDDEVHFDVRRADGVVLAGDTNIPDPVTERPIAGKAIFEDGVLHNKPVRIVSMYVRPKGAIGSETVLVQVAETLNKRSRTANEILSGVLLPQLGLILLTILLVRIGITRSLIPLDHLRNAIRDRSHQDLTPIPEELAPQEVLPVLRAVNDLMQQLNQVLTAQRHFIANAAHQLRTPLAGLATQVDLALRLTDHDARQHSLTQIRAGIERTSHLMQQLLALARAESAIDAPENFENLDLAALARAQTAEAVPCALEKNIDLGYEPPEAPVVIRGQPVLLREMLSNVLDNAVRYTPEGGKITVRLIAGDRSRLTIEDNGPGIPPGERQRVFQRFHRLDKDNESGSGLGLAIVMEIARAHNARVWIEPATKDSGSRVNIEFHQLPHS